MNESNELILVMQGELALEVVEDSTTNELPDGDTHFAWMNLKKKFERNTSQTLIRLKRKFTSSKLQSWKSDPDSWISKLDLIQKRLKD